MAYSLAELPPHIRMFLQARMASGQIDQNTMNMLMSGRIDLSQWLQENDGPVFNAIPQRDPNEQRQVTSQDPRVTQTTRVSEGAPPTGYQRAQAEEARRAQVEAEQRARAQAEQRAQEEQRERARQAQVEAEQRARAQAEAEQRVRAEAQARARQAQAEAEQRARIQAEQRARVQAEQRAQVEAQARARAQAEAQAREAQKLQLSRMAQAQYPQDRDQVQLREITRDQIPAEAWARSQEAQAEAQAREAQKLQLSRKSGQVQRFLEQAQAQYPQDRDQVYGREQEQMRRGQMQPGAVGEIQPTERPLRVGEMPTERPLRVGEMRQQEQMQPMQEQMRQQGISPMQQMLQEMLRQQDQMQRQQDQMQRQSVSMAGLPDFFGNTTTGALPATTTASSIQQPWMQLARAMPTNPYGGPSGGGGLSGPFQANLGTRI